MLQSDYLRRISDQVSPQVKAIQCLAISPGMNPRPFRCLEVLSNLVPPNSLIPSPTSPAGHYTLVTLAPLLLLQHSEHTPTSGAG